MSLLHLLEPEETIGGLWHRLVGGGSSMAHFPQEAVRFGAVAGRLRVFFHGLGGAAGVDLRPAMAEASGHRLNGRVRLGSRNERVARARYDGERFSLPDQIDVFPDRDLNETLYFWLAAWAIVGEEEPLERPRDPLARDWARLAHAIRTSTLVLARFPGLAKHYVRLSEAICAGRRSRPLPDAEAGLEAAIMTSLSAVPNGPEAAEVAASAALHATRAVAPPGYKTYLPVPLWGEIDPATRQKPSLSGEEEPGSGRDAGGDGKSRRARRRASDQIERKEGLFVHRFEKILTWTEFMNLHRDVEDDDDENARKAADDHDEIGVGKLERKTSTRLKIDLDLAPSDVDMEALSDKHVYPEWDYRRATYHANHVRVLERTGEAAEPGTGWLPGPRIERRIRSVRRQFEALRPRRVLLGRQLDGHELDMDALIRAYADVKARGEGSDHIFRQAREQARDLSVAVLIDVSRSTESFIEGRSVIDVEREALIALSEGLDACGDEAAILAFSSLRRDRVYIARLKEFHERPGPLVRARIGALKPGFYTRLGAAVRHASTVLAERSSRKKLLLVLTDGKPNDLDHYEGRYGIEDTRRAILEARRAGQTVFGITIDDKAQGYFPRIFGAGGYAIVGKPSRLTTALPLLYRHLIS